MELLSAVEFVELSKEARLEGEGVRLPVGYPEQDVVRDEIIE